MAGGDVKPIMRHADHDPNLVCRPAFGNGLCEPLIVTELDRAGWAIVRDYYRARGWPDPLASQWGRDSDG